VSNMLRRLSRIAVPLSRAAQHRTITAVTNNTQRAVSAPSQHVAYARCLVRMMSTGVETTIPVPSMGDSITEGTVVSFLKEVGEYAAEDEVVVQIETDKVTVDVAAPFAGTISAFCCGEDDTVEVGAELFKMTAGGEAPAAAAPAPAAAAPAPAAAAPAPAAAAAAPPAAAAPAPAAANVEEVGATEVGLRTETKVPLSQMRKRISERLKESQNTAAMLTTFNEIDMHNLMEMRSKYKDLFEKKHGVKLGFMSAFVRACSIALKAEPAVNSMIDGTDQVFFDYADIGFAAATPKGLVVPILRNAESMSFKEIEQTIQDLGQKARDNRIAIEDMVGGTFTISNGGVFGSLMGTPILNRPQSAVLGMHGIVNRPVAVNGAVEIRPMMYVALTYDHRIIDGREAVTFLKTVKEMIEMPKRMVIEV